MNTSITPVSSTAGRTAERSLPASARGRALHTVDWFLNGSPRLRDHDAPQLSVRHCHTGQR
jgi:hypothetical protein